MEDWKKQAFIEIRDTLLKYGRDTTFIHIYLVYMGVKPGALLQMGRHDLKHPEVKKILKQMQWLGLYVTKRHGVYVTKDRSLYKKWNSLLFGISKQKRDNSYAHEFLGYPKCCVEYETGNEYKSDVIISEALFYTYLKKLVSGNLSPEMFLRIYVGKPHFTTHTPCNKDCHETQKLDAIYDKAIKANLWLTKPVIDSIDSIDIDSLIEDAEQLRWVLTPEFLEDEQRLKKLKNAKQRNISLRNAAIERKLLENKTFAHEKGVNSDDLRELLYEKEKVIEVIKKAVYILKSVSNLYTKRSLLHKIPFY